MVRSKNFKIGVRIEDIDLHQQQAPRPSRLKVKVTRSHSLTKYQDAYDRKSLWPPKSKVKIISSHHLYVSSLPLFGKQNAVPVSLEAGGGMPCQPKPTTTLLVLTSGMSKQSKRWNNGRGTLKASALNMISNHKKIFGSVPSHSEEHRCITIF